ncbi:MAG: hypothetical protein ACMUJM_25510 [bacterium]
MNYSKYHFIITTGMVLFIILFFASSLSAESDPQNIEMTRTDSEIKKAVLEICPYSAPETRTIEQYKITPSQYKGKDVFPKNITKRSILPVFHIYPNLGGYTSVKNKTDYYPSLYLGKVGTFRIETSFINHKS